MGCTVDNSESRAFRDARRHKRVPARLPVAFGVETLDHRAVAENISLGGVYLNTSEILTSGTRITMKIEFPQGPVWHRGEVVWAIAAPKYGQHTVCGMGVRFFDATPEWLVLFSSLEGACDPAQDERDDVTMG